MRPGVIRSGAWIVAVAGLFMAALPAFALITRPLPLENLLTDSDFVVVAKVDSLDAKRPAMMLVVGEALKGKPDLKKMPVLLIGDKRAKKFKEQPDLLKRIATKLKVVVFITKGKSDYLATVYSNGTWFSIVGTTVEGEVRWEWTHLEPYLRRTFSGTTAELIQTTRDALSGKRKPPGIDNKVKPGLGPEAKKSSRLHDLRDDSCVEIAVVPTVFIGGPLALLAMLFPTVFGGWQRWLVLLSTAGTTSTLYSLHWWFAEDLVGSWMGTPLALWIAMSLVNVVGLVWAWQRHATRVQMGEAPLLASWVERLLLAVVSVLGITGVVLLRRFDQSLFSPFSLPIVALIAAFWAGTAYVLWTWLRGPRLVPALASEAAVLLGLVLASVALTPALSAQGTSRTLLSEGAQEATIDLAWKFRLPERGAISSTPVVVGDRVYIATAIDNAFRPYGALYCLDRDSGNIVWMFNDGKKMKQVHSTPVVVGNRIFLGEGFHQDDECKVYCLATSDGKKVWEHKCESHTESTPFVVGDRVFIGAGDDGMYCLEAATGKKVWNFPGFHIDAGPLVVGDRVYVGCGVGDVFKETMMFCIDAKKGTLIWRMPVDLPVWNRPIFADGRVYIATGNGRLNESDDNPAGAVLCLMADTGKPIWKRKLPDGVLGRLVADGKYLYLGCRDGQVYALWQGDGQVAWKRNVGTPIVTSPGVERPGGETILGPLYIAGYDGIVTCLERRSGKALWIHDVRAVTKVPVELISNPVVNVRRNASGQEERRLYLGVTIQGSARIGELHCYAETLGEGS